MARLQVAFLYILGSVYYTRLGEYREGWFADPRVAPLSAAFQARLSEIEDTIHARNLERVMPYTTLLPSRIPQSTNI